MNNFFTNISVASTVETFMPVKYKMWPLDKENLSRNMAVFACFTIFNHALACAYL
jgi:hypothetical protein